VLRVCLKDAVLDNRCSYDGRLFQAVGVVHENARWPNFNRLRGSSLVPDRSRDRADTGCIGDNVSVCSMNKMYQQTQSVGDAMLYRKPA